MTGVLRAAINLGNRALVQQDGDALTGVSPALARRWAEANGLSFEPVIYHGAGKVFEDAGRDVWDVAFMAVDPLRAEHVTFSRPYHIIEATYGVRAGSSIRAPSDADRAGVTVVAAKGSAYELVLRRDLTHATLEHAATPGDSFEAFKAGRGDVVAGVRASLERFFGDDGDVTILGGVLATVEQAMVLPGKDHPGGAALDAFVAEAVETGFVARALRPPET
ncbi:MAG: transporter substrate-binding domain-containing protein [Pseudomonadota bacterium]